LPIDSHMKLVVILCLFSLSLFAQEEESEALRAMRLSCEKQKVALGCFNYANMLARLEKNEEADKAFELGCKLGDSPSCKKEKWDLPAPVAAKVPTDAPIEPKESVSTPEQPMSPPPEETLLAPEEESTVPESTDMSLDTGDTINQ